MEKSIGENKMEDLCLFVFCANCTTGKEEEGFCQATYEDDRINGL